MHRGIEFGDLLFKVGHAAVVIHIQRVLDVHSAASFWYSAGSSSNWFGLRNLSLLLHLARCSLCWSLGWGRFSLNWVRLSSKWFIRLFSLHSSCLLLQCSERSRDKFHDLLRSLNSFDFSLLNRLVDHNRDVEICSRQLYLLFKH